MDELQIFWFWVSAILIFSLIIKILVAIWFVLIVYALLWINFKLWDIRNKFYK